MDSGTQFLWECQGINGGTNASCSLDMPDLTASTVSPTTASLNIAQTFTATVSNANNQTFDNFFQISTDPDMLDDLLIVAEPLATMIGI